VEAGVPSSNPVSSKLDADPFLEEAQDLACPCQRVQAFLDHPWVPPWAHVVEGLLLEDALSIGLLGLAASYLVGGHLAVSALDADHEQEMLLEVLVQVVVVVQVLAA
jgi:hypothetical protein